MKAEAKFALHLAFSFYCSHLCLIEPGSVISVMRLPAARVCWPGASILACSQNDLLILWPGQHARRRPASRDFPIIKYRCSEMVGSPSPDQPVVKGWTTATRCWLVLLMSTCNAFSPSKTPLLVWLVARPVENTSLLS